MDGCNFSGITKSGSSWFLILYHGRDQCYGGLSLKEISIGLMCFLWWCSCVVFCFLYENFYFHYYLGCVLYWFWDCLLKNLQNWEDAATGSVDLSSKGDGTEYVCGYFGVYVGYFEIVSGCCFCGKSCCVWDPGMVMFKLFWGQSIFSVQNVKGGSPEPRNFKCRVLDVVRSWLRILGLIYMWVCCYVESFLQLWWVLGLDVFKEVMCCLNSGFSKQVWGLFFEFSWFIRESLVLDLGLC